MRVPRAGAGAIGSPALAPASVKRSPRWMVSPVTVTLGSSAASAWPMRGASRSSTASNDGTRLLMMRLLDLIEGRHHLIGGLDDLRIHLVSALCRDEVGDLRDDVDIRGFEKALLNRAKRGRAGIARHRRAGGRRLRQKVAALLRHTRFVREIDELELSHGLGIDLSRDLRQDLTIRIDRDVGRVLRQGDAGLNDESVSCDDLAGRAQLKGSGPRIGRTAVRHLDLEEAAALDSQVERIVGVDEIALPGDAIDGRRLDARADLNADRDKRSGIRRIRADIALVLIEQILEFGALRFEGRRVEIGDVIGDDLDIELLSKHPGRGDGERAHDLSSLEP